MGSRVEGDPTTLRELETALGQFRGDASVALAEVTSEAERTAQWLNERLAYWRTQVLQATADVRQAQVALNSCVQRAMAAASRRYRYRADAGPGVCQAEQHVLAAARARLEDARIQVTTVEVWTSRVAEARSTWMRTSHQFGRLLNGDVPRARAYLAARAKALERFGIGASPIGGAVVATASRISSPFVFELPRSLGRSRPPTNWRFLRNERIGVKGEMIAHASLLHMGATKVAGVKLGRHGIDRAGLVRVNHRQYAIFMEAKGSARRLRRPYERGSAGGHVQGSRDYLEYTLTRVLSRSPQAATASDASRAKRLRALLRGGRYFSFLMSSDLTSKEWRIWQIEPDGRARLVSLGHDES